MADALDIANQLLLEPAELSESRLADVLSGMLGNRLDAADMYFQNTYHETWALEDSKVKEGSYNIDRGVGVRAVSGEKTGFAYSDDVILPALTQAASAAKSIAVSGGDKKVAAWNKPTHQTLYPSIDPIQTMDKAEKIALLELVDKTARATDPRVIKVNASLSSEHDVVLIATANGEMNADVRPLVRLNVSVIVESNGRRESGFCGGGGRGGLEIFTQDGRAEKYAREAVRTALVNLEAVDAPAGTMPVVLGSGWPGILLHEAIGHGLEGDFNRKGVSAFSGRIGERVAAPGVTVVDDATLPNRRGSLNIDDEGTQAQNTVLIEDGILKGYMLDKLNARLMGMQSTGNCRRESYAHVPLVRMTNTYMQNGKYDPEEILKSVENGLYAVNFGGGQVDITSGKFVFSASEAYLIENGKITTPVKGATLIGNGPDVLTKVSMVGNDLALDEGVGVCGKEGQSVPVGVGQPTLKVDSLTVGGTNKVG